MILILKDIKIQIILWIIISGGWKTRKGPENGWKRKSLGKIKSMRNKKQCYHDDDEKYINYKNIAVNWNSGRHWTQTVDACDLGDGADPCGNENDSEYLQRPTIQSFSLDCYIQNSFASSKANKNFKGTQEIRTKYSPNTATCQKGRYYDKSGVVFQGDMKENEDVLRFKPQEVHEPQSERKDNQEQVKDNPTRCPPAESQDGVESFSISVPRHEVAPQSLMASFGNLYKESGCLPRLFSLELPQNDGGKADGLVNQAVLCHVLEDEQTSGEKVEIM